MNYHVVIMGDSISTEFNSETGETIETHINGRTGKKTIKKHYRRQFTCDRCGELCTAITPPIYELGTKPTDNDLLHFCDSCFEIIEQLAKEKGINLEEEKC